MKKRSLPVDLRALYDRFVVCEEPITVGERVFDIIRPRNADDLISEADYVMDERLPYWADIWPSSTALAGVAAGLDGRGKRALELGCGLGLVTVGALRAGFNVLASDYYEDALLFARRNGLRNAGREPETRMVDWRVWPADLGRFDLLLASDVLYERTHATLVADAIVSALRPGGRALIADPGRVALLAFVTACEERGCRASVHARIPWAEGIAKQTITIHEISAPDGG